jgi:uridine kinase
MSEAKEKRQKLESPSPEHRRTLRFLVSLAAQAVFPDRTLSGGHAVGDGYCFSLGITQEQLVELESAVRALIARNLAISAQDYPFEKVLSYLESNRQPHAALLLRSRVTKVVRVHECEGQIRLYATDLYPATGLVTNAFAFHFLGSGDFVLSHTASFKPQPAIMQSIREHLKWDQTSSGVTSFGQLNNLQYLPQNTRRNLILECEFRQEQKLCEIAARIADRQGKVRVLCIAGPTSSGKTTFANKLAIYLKNSGYEARPLSVDHYYLELPDQPKFKERSNRADVNYDHIEAMDVPLANAHIVALTKGETVMTPQYSFKSGLREGAGHSFTLPERHILIIEGIHALNPAYTQGVPPEALFKIYISPLSALQVDDFNAVKTTNHRLLRRMCRDFLFRGYSVSQTLAAWAKVRAGEHSFIFPHQNNCDYVMNSAMEYELCVLKTYVEPGLSKVLPSDPNFELVQELLLTFKYLDCWDDRNVPSTSLLREFIGNGAFDEH